MDIVRVWEGVGEVVKRGPFLRKSDSRSSVGGAEEDAGGSVLPELNASAMEDPSVLILSLSSLDTFTEASSTES